MYLDNTPSCNSRATTRDERDVQWERDYKHKKAIGKKGGNMAVSIHQLLNVTVGGESERGERWYDKWRRSEGGE